MAFDNLPPGTRDSDRDAPWNERDHDGAEYDHAIEQVCGGDAQSTAETFAEFVANEINSEEQDLLVSSTMLGAVLGVKPSNDDLLKIILSSRNLTTMYAAACELRARYLADKYTQSVIETHADKWVAGRREAMADAA